MRDVGWAGLGIVPTFDRFGQKLEAGTSKELLAAGAVGGEKFGAAAGTSAGKRFGGVFTKLAKASLIGLAGAGALAVNVGADAISAASDLAESENKVQQVFGDASGRVFDFAEKAADKLGQTNQQARDAAATFGIFAGAAKLSDEKSAKFAIRMSKLASDLASFHNTSPDAAIEALGAALRGESEPIRAYGVLLDEATLKAEALEMGLLKPTKNKAQIQAYQVAVIEGQKKLNDAQSEFGKGSLEAIKAQANLGTAQERLRKATEGTIPPLTQSQKVLAAQSAIMKQTKVAQGDFARTSDGLANAQRRLSARWEDAKAKLGEALLPAMEDAVGFMLDDGIPAVERFAGWFTDKGVPALRDFADEVKPTIGAVKDLVGWLSDLPGEAKIASLAALLGGVGAVKLRGGRGGALGTVGSALGLSKPVPVFVTNQGFGSGAGGGSIPDKVAKGGWVAAAGLSASIAAGMGLGMKETGDWLGKKLGEDVRNSLTAGWSAGSSSGSGMSAPSGWLQQDLADDANKNLEKVKPTLDSLNAKLATYGDALDLAGRTKVDPDFALGGVRAAQRELQRYIAQQVEARRPVRTDIVLTGIERALRQVETLNAGLRGQVERGTDNGLTYAHGGGGGGLTISGPVTVKANTTRELQHGLTTIKRRGAMGGWGG